MLIQSMVTVSKRLPQLPPGHLQVKPGQRMPGYAAQYVKAQSNHPLHEVALVGPGDLLSPDASLLAHNLWGGTWRPGPQPSTQSSEDPLTTLYGLLPHTLIRGPAFSLPCLLSNPRVTEAIHVDFSPIIHFSIKRVLFKRRWTHPSSWQYYWQQPRGGMTQCPSTSKWKTTGVTSDYYSAWREETLTRPTTWCHRAQWSQTDRRQVLYGSTFTRYREQSNSWREKRKVMPGGLEKRETGSCCSMGTGFQFCKTERVLEIEVTAIWMFLALPNCTCRNG